MATGASVTCCRLLDVIAHESFSISKARRLGMFVSVAAGGPPSPANQASVSVNGDVGVSHLQLRLRGGT